MTFASDVAGNGQEHEDDMQGESSDVNVGEVMSGAGCNGNDCSTDLGCLEGVVQASGSHRVENNVVPFAPRMLGDIVLDRTFPVVDSSVCSEGFA